MKYYIFLILFISVVIESTDAQDKAYAHQVVDTLAGHYMKGRGYVDDGVGKAAEYIAGEFDRLGLKKVKNTYSQQFNNPVNTFPGAMELAIDGQQLVPGESFLIGPGSPKVEGTFELVRLSYSDLAQESKWLPAVRASAGKFIAINDIDKDQLSNEQLQQANELINFFKYHPDNPAKGTIVITSDKLTWAGSTQVLTKPNFIIKHSDINEDAKRVSVKVDQEYYDDYRMKNVIGKIEGKNKDSVLIFSAHYDHLGMMGENTIFPGANDNASGIAMLLNMAQFYTSNKPKYTIYFIAFAGEELGLLGSKYYTENPLFPLSQIKFMINLDIAGTGDDGIQVVNGSVFKSEFGLMNDINDRLELLPQIKVRGESCNSDHCMFYQLGVPSFFIYTLGGIQAYHDIYDRSETLPLTVFEGYFKLLTTFVDEL